MKTKIQKHLHVNGYKTTARALDMKGSAVFHLSDWANLSHPERLRIFRMISMQRGRDPRIANVAVSILRKAGVKPRDYEGQAKALLRWVQENVYFVNEPGERIQDPIRTLKVRYGDCDDMSILLAALFESLNLPWRFVQSGVLVNADGSKTKLRYIEGEDTSIFDNTDIKWVHIYNIVGTPPFHPHTWFFAEPSVQGVPLGWDVVSGDKAYLPEMLQSLPKKKGSSWLFSLGRPSPGFKPAKLPPAERRSPAYEMSYGDASGFGILAGGLTAADMLEDEVFDEDPLVPDTAGKRHRDPIEWDKVAISIGTGVTVSVLTSMILDWINGKGVFDRRGSS